MKEEFKNDVIPLPKNIVYGASSLNDSAMISKCCNADVRREGDVTYFTVCLQCNEACDIIFEEYE
jgi:hypothetical protein